MNILLTGATGFLGRRLLEHLTELSISGVLLLRSALPVETDIGFFKIKKTSFPSLNGLDKEVFDDIDSVIHLAGRAHIFNDSLENSAIAFRETNVDLTFRLATLAASNGVKRFVFVSSIGVLGVNSKSAFTEDSNVSPYDLYTSSKLDAEKVLTEVGKETGMEIVIVRPPLIYGPMAPGNFLRLIKMVQKFPILPFGSINNKRSFIALDNIVDFLAFVADPRKTPKAANEIFVICDGEDVSTTALIDKIIEAFGIKCRNMRVPVYLMRCLAKLLGKESVSDRLFGDLLIDSSKARKLLLWSPVTTMDEQLSKIATCDLKKKTC